MLFLTVIPKIKQYEKLKNKAMEKDIPESNK